MRRLFVPICFGLLLVLGVPSVQAGNQEEANKIAQRLTQQYPQYNIEVAYQEGTVRLRGDVASEADRDEIANFVRRIPKVRAVSESMNVTPNAALPVEQAPIRAVQALTPVMSEPITYVDEAIPAYQSAPLGSAIPAAPPAAQGVPMSAPMGTPVAAPGATRSPSDFFAPQGAATPVAQDGRPNVPNYAWPSYASYPNYSQVTYPKAYANDAFPYVGPFYPYPEVPLGWRQVTLKWHDGYWWLDFNDGSKNGPFSPLFRHPQRYR
ncbi:MAG: BON domain-containing protein [Thermoguttaceae bacterium]|nr:BON domain-containing protein [Thermoguttaceae bacterium]